MGYVDLSFTSVKVVIASDAQELVALTSYSLMENVGDVEATTRISSKNYLQLWGLILFVL